jgi:ABC-type multidrug transport system permease subunit
MWCASRLPVAFRAVARLNPITWQVDVLRFATIGLGGAEAIAAEAAAFVVFAAVCFWLAVKTLQRES